MCQYGSPHVTADVGGAEGERWEWRVSELQPPTLPSPPLPLALASLVHRPASHCSRGRESGCCFPQISVPSAPSFTFVSKARFFYLSSGSGLCPLLTSSGPLQGRLLSASPPNNSRPREQLSAQGRCPSLCPGTRRTPHPLCLSAYKCKSLLGAPQLGPRCGLQRR